MTIRLATVLDLERLTEMATRFLQETAYGRVCGAAPPERIAPVVSLVLEGGVGLVAVVGGSLVAFCGLVESEHVLSGERFADEVALWVEPEYRSGTIGPRLIRAAEDWARQRGLSYLKMVAPDGAKLNRFLRRQGYAAVETAYLLRL